MKDEEFIKLTDMLNNFIDKAISNINEMLEEDREQMRIYMEKKFLILVGNNVYSRMRVFAKRRLRSAEVAEILDIKVGSVDKKVHRGEIRAHRDANGHYYFFRDELDEDIFSSKDDLSDD